MKKIYLADKKEKAVLRRHPWVFSGAIARTDQDIEDGEIVSVRDSHGSHLGYGYYNSRTRIAARILSFGDEGITPDYLRKLIASSAGKRTGNPRLEATDSYRLVFSEGDFLPGLIVDNYAGHLVLQCLTLGMDRLKQTIVELLVDILRPASIYERSEHAGRSLEGLGTAAGQLYGDTPEELIINEDVMRFRVDLRAGQKTGFYLDQRDNRTLVKSLARGRDVVNLFCYTGGFSIPAALGGARSVLSVDASSEAIEMARNNMALNGSRAAAEYATADIFHYLRDEPLTGDFIILDPPALAKNRASVENACRGYKDLHLQVASKCPPGSLVLTCSCSRFIGMDLFQKVLFAAFTDAGRNASIIGRYGHPADHPTSIFCPETEYLKAMLLMVQ